MGLSDKVVSFFEKQNFVIVATLDGKGAVHCSAKGIIGVDLGEILVADLYLTHTYKNLKKNPQVSLTAVEEHSFTGYTLQGKARLVVREDIPVEWIEQWESRIVKRMSHRVVKGVQNKSKSRVHFEAGLPPHLQYVMAVRVDNVVDLAPPGRDRNHHG